MVNIREGGLAIYGAIIAGFLTILVFAKIKKNKFLKILDFVSPAVMIGQIIGRWGNFMNAEAFGYETDLPWRMGIHVSASSDPETLVEMSVKYVHPTFLYESLWNLIGFLIINAVYKKKKFDGQIFFMYIAWYGLGRAFIEGLRTDSLMLGPIRISQLIGALAFAVGLFFLIFFAKRSKRDDAVPEIASTLDLGTETGEQLADTGDTEEQPEEAEAVIEESSDGENDGEDN